MIDLQLSTNVQQQFIFATSPCKHGYCMNEECFQDIANESRILDVIRTKEKYDFFFKGENYHPNKDCNTHEQSRIHFIE
jgi:hypothetical protein